MGHHREASRTNNTDKRVTKEDIGRTPTGKFLLVMSRNILYQNMVVRQL